MAVGIFLNFEKVSMRIIEAEIEQMTDDNIIRYDDGAVSEIKEDVFIKNLMHGAIAITFIVNLYETVLNGIIGHFPDDKEKYGENLYERLEIICEKYKIDFHMLIKEKLYKRLYETIKLRNDITHFKESELCEGYFITGKTTLPKGKSREAIGKAFTKSYMENSYRNALLFIELLCDKCGLAINDECEIIDCDGKGAQCEFIVTKEKVHEEIEE